MLTKKYNFLFFIFLFLGILVFSRFINAVSIQMPKDTFENGKIQNNIYITTNDINYIYPDISKHYYYMRLPSTMNGIININQNDLKASIGIKNFSLYPIQTILPYEDIIIHEDTNESIYSFKFITGNATRKINAGINKDWIIEVESKPFEKGEYNLTIGGVFVDPTISACGILALANNVYIMNQSIIAQNITCISFGANNQTLDCDNYTITFNGTITNAIGVSSTSYNYSIVENCNINGFSSGIYFLNTYYGYMHNNFVTNQTSIGLRITNTAPTSGIFNNIIDNCTADEGGAQGIFLSTQYANVTNSYGLSNTSHGVRLNGADYCILENVTGQNRVSGSTSFGLFLDATATYNILRNISALSKGAIALAITSVTPCINNTLDLVNATASIATFGHAITIGSDNNTLNRITASTSSPSSTIYALSLSGNYCIVENSTFTRTVTGTSILTNGNYNSFRNVSASGQRAILVEGIYNNYTNCTFNGTTSNGILISGTHNIISDSALSTTTGSALNIFGSYNIARNCTSTTTTGNALVLGGSAATTNTTNNVIDTCSFFGATTLTNIGVGKVFASVKNVTDNTIVNSTFIATSTGATIGFQTTGIGYLVNNNTFINNTLISTSSTLIWIANSTIGGNTFYWNNFTDTTGLYVNDSNGSNIWNGSAYGIDEGNIWHNVINGSVEIIGSYFSSGFPSLLIGNSGTGYPYNSTTSLNKVFGMVDYSPLTNQGIPMSMIIFIYPNYNLTSPHIKLNETLKFY